MRRSNQNMLRTAFILSIIFATFLLTPTGVAYGQVIEIQSQHERTQDPTSITFLLRVKAHSALANARLIYKVLNPNGNVGGSGNGTFTPGREIDVSFTLETRTAQRYIPVGSIFTYHWELVDQNGNSVLTSEREFVFLDGRYAWQHQSTDQVTIFWYGNNEAHANAFLKSAEESLSNTGKLLEVDVPYPIRILMYQSDSEGELARRPRGRIFEELIQTGGQRVSTDLLLVFVKEPDIVRHEVAHIVTHLAGDGPFTSIPSWLDEGVAVYAQSQAGLAYTSALDFAIRTNDTLSLRSMQSSSNRVDEVNLFYGQSFSIVQFLIDEFGQDPLAELFRVHFDGSAIDQAMLEVYGFDQNGLYNLWRQDKGLKPLALSPAATATMTAAVEATRAPLGVPTLTSVTSTSSEKNKNQQSNDQKDETVPDPSELKSGDNAGIVVGSATVMLVIFLGTGAAIFLRKTSTRP